jgi:UPF0755 protein
MILNFFSKNRSSTFKLAGVVLVLFSLIIAVLAYKFLYSNNVAKSYVLRVKENTSYAQIEKELSDSGVIKSVSAFSQVASLMKYKKTEVPSGRYVIKTGMTNRALIAKLRSGNQDALNLTFNNVRTVQELAGLLSKSLEADSLSLLTTFTNEAKLSSRGLNLHTALTNFIPNTYDIFWNIKPEKFFDRMSDETDKFWSDERIQKAKKLNLNKEQVYSLAAIVEKESNNKSERPRIAGVYLNRLEIGDKLRADPTVVFAVGDFTLRRVLLEHLNFDSPYNTYKYAGIPPGPIYMPSTNSIDAVLNPEDHEYLFFCAKPGYNSEHAFAKTAEQHSQNASVYHRWLSSEGIK